MTSIATNSTHATINAADAWGFIADLDGDLLGAAKESKGWACVMLRTIDTAHHTGANWHDVAAGLEAWFTARMPLPDDETERAALAALHGLYDGLVTGRVAYDGEAGFAAYDTTVGALTEALGELEGPAIGSMLRLLDIQRECLWASGHGDTEHVWTTLKTSCAWMAVEAYGVGGDDLCASLAEAVRVVTRAVKS